MSTWDTATSGQSTSSGGGFASTLSSIFGVLGSLGGQQAPQQPQYVPMPTQQDKPNNTPLYIGMGLVVLTVVVVVVILATRK